MFHLRFVSVCIVLLLATGALAGCARNDGATVEPGTSTSCTPIPGAPDSDGDGLTDQEEVWWGTDPRVADTDGDGMPDGEEIAARRYPYSADQITGKDADRDGIPDGAEVCVLHTDPRSYSSDGDRYGDGIEHFGVFLNGYQDANPHGILDLPSDATGGPLTPDVPDIVIEVSQPKLKLAKTITVGRTTLAAKEYSEDLSTSTSKQRSRTHTVEAGVELHAVGTLAYPQAHESGVKGTIDVFGSYKFTGSHQWTSTTSASERFAGVSREEWQTSEITSIGDPGNPSTFEATLKIRNVGTDLLRSGIKDIAVNFYLGEELMPGGTWTLSSSDTTYAIEKLLPGDTVTLAIVRIPIDAATFKMFMSGTPIDAVVEHYSFGEDQEFLQNARGRAAQIDVDTGNGPVTRRYVSVPEGGLPLPDAYNTFGSMIVGPVGDVIAIASIDGTAVSLGGTDLPLRSWATYLTPFTGTAPPRNITDLIVHRGDRVMLTFDADSDGDRLTDRYERLIGLDPENADTDGDGLKDGVELLALQRPDGREIATNPLLVDTDGDGISDLDDPDPTWAPGDALDEIIVREKAEIRVYGRNATGAFGVVLNFTDPRLASVTGPVFLVAGDVAGDAKDEIFATWRDTCTVYDARRGEIMATWECIMDQHYEGPTFAVGDFIAGGKDEIVVLGTGRYAVSGSYPASNCHVWNVLPKDAGVGYVVQQVKKFDCGVDHAWPSGMLARMTIGETDALVAVRPSASRCHVLDVPGGTEGTGRVCTIPNAQMTAAGDVDGDNVEDLVVAARGSSAGRSGSCWILGPTFDTSVAQKFDCGFMNEAGRDHLAVANLDANRPAAIIICSDASPLADAGGCTKYGRDRIGVDMGIPWGASQFSMTAGDVY